MYNIYLVYIYNIIYVYACIRKLRTIIIHTHIYTYIYIYIHGLHIAMNVGIS